jgi:NhaC family Na+:H+ antiporter
MLKKYPLLVALVPMVFLIAMLSYNVTEVFSDDALGGSNQLTLLLSAGLGGFLAILSGTEWKKIIKGITKSIASTVPSILILLFIGSLAGTWLISGVVPAMVYYGLNILSPSIFLVATVLICALVSLATGSSWSTVATVGIAMLGIGQAMGFSEAMVAGAIISGAYFGDKVSPMSDTTNLAPAMAGTDLFTHIRYMMYTTVPSMAITLIIFLFLGFAQAKSGEVSVDHIQSVLTDNFTINGWLFIVPVAVIGLIVARVPALPALMIGTLLGGVFAVIFQPHLIVSLAGLEGASFFKSAYVTLMNSMTVSTQLETGDPVMNDLLSSGGMGGMMNTIWLIICAMAFGGVMESAGFLKTIGKAIIKLAKNTLGLVSSTAASCLFLNVTASDQYLAIVVPGRMFAKIYEKRGLKPEVLSRTLEDSGTVTSVLVPWNTCGATQAGVLGVATIAFAPYCFFNIISPVMTIFVTAINYKIRRIEPKEVAV